MARNSEKQYGRLNRTILAREREEFEKKHPKRPTLSHLHTADEIKQWLPSIKKDLEFNLKQSQVICYPDRKITELRNNVDQLEQDYKRFVRKMKQLDSSIKYIPWTDRPYESKRKKIEDEPETSSDLVNEISTIVTPILNGEESRITENLPIANVCLELQDLPLDFKASPDSVVAKSNSASGDSAINRINGKYTFCDENAVLETEQKLKGIFGLTPNKETRIVTNDAKYTNLVGYLDNSDSDEGSD